MANGYDPLPNPRSHRNTNSLRVEQEEMHAAFDYSEDEGDDLHTPESQPLNQASSAPLTIDFSLSHSPSQGRTPAYYDFENVDYDYPPPGSPPHPSARAIPNDIGNSNGLVGSTFTSGTLRVPRQIWIKRAAAAVLPAHFAQRIGVVNETPSGPVGGGTINDGVFANVTAKPARPIRVQNGDDTYMVPEDVRSDIPPSYASAQADAVPPYWETTVHAPFSPDSIGEMIIDSLPTGSIFSFCWNMLVSISFQFVGFLLTYLMHTTHAAKLGSRAGLGVTLIQYGIALRGKMTAEEPEGYRWGNWQGDPSTSAGTRSASGAWTGSMDNATATAPYDSVSEDQDNQMFASVTTEWLSFFLMTIGWFMLLTSVIGFWRVKRWERGVMASQHANSSTDVPANPGFLAHMENTFSFRRLNRVDLFRNGFRFGGRRHPEDEAVARAEAGEQIETDQMIQADPPRTDAERTNELLAHDRRIRAALTSAGFL